MIAHLDEHYPEKLSEWQLFTGNQHDLTPNARVLPYEVHTSLFSNHAAKVRTVWLPEGTQAKYRPQGAFDLPVGAILSKTFSYGERRIETRLYIHKQNGWQGVTYVWNREQTDAVLDVTPEPVPITWNGMQIDYDIPNVNQCKTCHEGPRDNGPLGITARNLKYTSWQKAGILNGAPPEPVPATSLEARARDYLDVNCASCHVVGGRGMKSAVFLTAAERSPHNLGVCKPATDVPSSFDIVPGKPDRSMLVHRMTSLDRKIMMPDIGHSVVDRDGVNLIREWIAAMPGSCPAT